jgi:hypothetical protein
MAAACRARVFAGVLGALAFAAAVTACATGGTSDPDGAVGSPADGAVPDAPIDPPDAMMPGDAGVDAGPTCSPCQLVDQCGCGGGEACDLGGPSPGQGTTTCRAVTAPGTAASTCSGTTTCASGFTCLGPAGGASCKRFCKGDGECDGGGGLCTVQVTYNNVPIPGVKVCSPKCDPFTAVGCPTGWGCHFYYNNSESRSFTWCAPAGGGGQGAACLDDGDCSAGHGCFCTDALCLQQKCLKSCQRAPAGGPGCTGGRTCFALTPPATIGTIEYGVCN